MAIVLRKDEKIQVIIDKLGEDCNIDEFILCFKDYYPKDWEKINNTYTKHQNKNKSKKKPTHPMPKPEQYIKNMLNVWLKNRI